MELEELREIHSAHGRVRVLNHYREGLIAETRILIVLYPLARMRGSAMLLSWSRETWVLRVSVFH